MTFLFLETRSVEMFEFRVFEKKLIPKLGLSVWKKTPTRESSFSVLQNKTMRKISVTYSVIYPVHIMECMFYYVQIKVKQWIKWYNTIVSCIIQNLLSQKFQLTFEIDKTVKKDEWRNSQHVFTVWFLRLQRYFLSLQMRMSM